MAALKAMLAQHRYHSEAAPWRQLASTRAAGDPPSVGLHKELQKSSNSVLGITSRLLYCGQCRTAPPRARQPRLSRTTRWVTHRPSACLKGSRKSNPTSPLGVGGLERFLFHPSFFPFGEGFTPPPNPLPWTWTGPVARGWSAQDGPRWLQEGP